MNNENKSYMSEERKRLLEKDLKEGLQGLKKIFISTIALLLYIGKAIKEKSKTALVKYKTNKSDNESKSSLSIIKDSTSHSESVEVTIEDNFSKGFGNKLTNNFIYPVLALISTTTLFVGVIRIEPLLKWANTQNECVENTIGYGTNSKQNLAQRVMICNGGHEN